MIVSSPNPSVWLAPLADVPPRPPLRASRRADVCIVGGGLTGLWTAYELLRAQPGLEVVLLEAGRLGCGASGRSAGVVVGWPPGGLQPWERLGGAGAAKSMALAFQRTVAEIQAAIAREEIDCDWHAAGSLVIAQTPAQLQRLRAERERQLQLGGEPLAHRLLDARQLQERVDVHGALGALYTPHGARLQPTRLAAGLAAASERLGARIFEHSRVREVAPGAALLDGGEVRARVVVLATEAYTGALAGWERRMLALRGAALLTEPVDPELWAEARWDGGETLADAYHLFCFLQRTGDGRIAIALRACDPGLAGLRGGERPPPRRMLALLRIRLRFMFPALARVRVAGAWQGAIALSRDGCPSVWLDRESGIAWAGGFGDEGLAGANLAARTLSEVILEREGELAALPWRRPPRRDWGPRPLRALTARQRRRLYRAADRRELRTGRSSALAAAANRIGSG